VALETERPGPLPVGSPAPVRTFKRRGGRITGGQAEARARLWSAYGLEVEVEGQPLDLASLFGRRAPVVLEIGFGMGEATAAMAVAQPERDVLAVDVHIPGQGALMRLLDEHVLTNVRVAHGDAVELLRHQVADGSLTEVRVFFPDPWPKRRHWKRRLMGPEFAALVARRLAPGGRLHVATDWGHYAEQVRRVLAASEAFDLGQPVPWRARTRFEEQARTAGRAIHEVAALRR
jgi:tRNA (guanine-N7-)-methyltransferase